MLSRKGFTLAEVLITLSIIGVVAALTISPLVKSYQEAQYKNSFKKIYSDFSQAAKMLIIENKGDLTNYFSGGSDTIKKYCSYLKCSKICTSGAEGNCWHNDESYYKLNGAGDTQWIGSGMILNTGVLVAFYIDDAKCEKPENGINICNSIFVDVNGWKGPNTWGKDIFKFYTTKDGIHAGQGTGSYGNCSSSGYGCATWVLKNEDY